MSSYNYGDDGVVDVSKDPTGATSPLKAGAVLIDHIAITSGHYNQKTLDVKAQCTNLTIFESISDYHLSGRMTLIDGIDVLKNLKLVGQETVTVKARVPDAKGNFAEGDASEKGTSIDQVFRIYSITDYKVLNNNTASYVLHFVDPMAFEFHKKKINKVLRGRYSDMLANMMYEDAEMKLYLGDKNVSGIEDTVPENMQLVVPNWSINRCIKFFVENGEPADNKSYKNSMFFYQNLQKVDENDNQYRYQSFQTMCKKEMEHPVKFHYQGTSDHNTTNEKKYPYHTRNSAIIDFERPQKANTFLGIRKGAYASKMITYDPVRKIHEDTTYSISDVFDRGSEGHVQGHPMINAKEMLEICKATDFTEAGDSSSFSQKIFVEQRPDESFDDYTLHKVNMTNAYSDEAKLIDAESQEVKQQQLGLEYRDSGPLERRALLSLMEQNITRVKIPLRFDIMAGQNVQITLPTPEVKPQNGEEYPDELESNKYLVGKITYEISPAHGYGEVTMQCIKESFEKEISEYEPTFNVGQEEEHKFDQYGNEVYSPDDAPYSPYVNNTGKFSYGIGKKS